MDCAFRLKPVAALERINLRVTKELGSSTDHQFSGYTSISYGDETMTDNDRAEMRSLCDQFRHLMAREVEAPLFDKQACERIGELIGKAARQGRSDYVALR
jgi:hypothetical protein